MKKYYLCMLLLLALVGQGQTTIGLSFATPRWEALNSIVNRYNTARPWLDNEMGNPSFMPGFTASFGVKSKKDKLAIQLIAYRRNSTRLTAKGADQKRDLSIRLWTVSIFDATYFGVNKNRYKIGLGGSPTELSRLKLRTRVNDDKFQTIYKSPAFLDLFLTNASSTLHTDFVWYYGKERKANIHFRLYYTLGWFNDEELIYANEAINPSLADYHYANQVMGIGHLGFQVLLGLF